MSVLGQALFAVLCVMGASAVIAWIALAVEGLRESR